MIFNNDLPTSMSTSTLLLFADDTHTISAPSDCFSLQYDLDQLSSLCYEWNLHFNEDKCVIVRYTFRQVRVIFNCHLNSNQLGSKSIHRDLGIIMSESLCWKEHHNYLLKRAYRTLGLCRRTFRNVNCVQAKKLLYMSLVRCHLLYCSPVWRPQFIKDIISIENIQRRATKFILNDFRPNYKFRLTKLNLLPLMMELEIMFFISSFDIKTYVQFLF